MKLAPIALFIYNRPEHTRKTLEALKNNELAKDSVLFVYADGPKDNATTQELLKIEQTRDVIKRKKWCGEVHFIESKENKGLANSVIQGINEIMTDNSSVIVLEDDIVVNSGFLRYMNNGLNLYENEKRVFGVSGYKFDSVSSIKDKTYFLPVMSSWGYGIWKRSWDKIDFDSNNLMKKVKGKKLKNKMRFGKFNFFNMLEQQLNGEIDSWAVRFYTSMIIEEGLFLFPHKSLLKNIGLDGSGVHCAITDSQDLETIDGLDISKISVKVNRKILNKFNKASIKLFSLKELKKIIRELIAPEILQFYRRKKSVKQHGKFEDLKNVDRFVEKKINLKNTEFTVPDSASFLFMHDEIFEKGIYKFKTLNKTPYIIDGGANIGLSVMYFKEIYPDAQIVAFEPDPYIYNVLNENIGNLKFDGVKCVNKGLWDEETDLTFLTEGADAGTMYYSNDDNSDHLIKVKTTSLAPYLNKRVDFLKLDIEGAEFTVLKDVESKLDVVQNIFVEYHSFVDKEQDLSELLLVLKNAGFRLHINSPGLTSTQPFMKLNVYNRMDMQLNIYGYREITN